MARAEQSAAPPRVVVAGLAGDSGKSLVALGLAKALAARGFGVAAFKKGPDFIDAAWLAAASGRDARNLDTFLMPKEALVASFVQGSAGAGVAVIEGNRGLYDGFDARGTHSTAALAKLLAAPVVLVVDTTKATRTVAALVLGCRNLDQSVPIAGVILNRVGTARQEKLIRQAIDDATDVPVLGAIRRIVRQHLPSRHLGLVTAMEHPDTQATLEELGRVIEREVDVARVLDVARSAPSLECPPLRTRKAIGTSPVRIGVLRDQAFSFYYPENLEALEAAGGSLSFLSPLADESVPEIDALYAGGGFPEVHARALSANESFRRAIALRIAGGMPVWAECGGLSYLARTLTWQGERLPMVGALPIDVEHTEHPQGHGYATLVVDRDNPFFPAGTELSGHEFHYGRLADQHELPPTAFAVQRGTGVGGGRDGIMVDNVVASFTHLHALGAPDWAARLVRAAAEARAQVGHRATEERTERPHPVVATGR
ncbi:MAG: cobyrinate a,c-diamide synthase, partial [Deltaproteobacteria bacterium]|nr:cobyrinate a,c-diamide synthase [Deltaproteobacteria bacterium]MBW2531385.1 cobyrinate a,c-diamide synthase [Deltaproteobacteria bacterium]